MYDNVTDCRTHSPYLGHAIYFASPKLTKAATKLPKGVTHLYMNLWTKEELEAYRQALCDDVDVPESRVEVSFAKYGGRIVPLEHDENGDRHCDAVLNYEIGKVDLENLLSAFEGEFACEKSALIHHLATNTVYNGILDSSFEFIPGSIELATKMLERLETLTHNRFNTLTEMINSESKASTFRGWLYENQINKAFWRGNKSAAPRSEREPLK